MLYIVLYTVDMEIEKIHKDYRNTIIKYEAEVERWQKMYNLQRASAAKLREALNKFNNDEGEKEMFDGFTYKEYKLVERIAVLQDQLMECKARLD